MSGWRTSKTNPYSTENWSDDVKKNRRCIHIIVAIVVLTLLLSIIATVIAVLGWQTADTYHSPTVHLINNVIPTTPGPHYLAATAIPLAMTLPNDLSGREGHVYRIWSRSAQPHTVQIASGGQNPKFDGGTTLATFGGAIGDGFIMEIIDKNRVVVGPVTNVVFT